MKKVFFQRACRIILVPPKHVLHLVWSPYVIYTAIRTALKVACKARILGKRRSISKNNKTIKDGDISPRPLGHNCPYGPMVRFDQRDWREHIYWLDQSYRKDPQARASCDASLHAFGAQAMATQNIFPSIRATGPMAWGSPNPLGQPWLLLTIPGQTLSVLVSLGKSWSVLFSLG